MSAILTWHRAAPPTKTGTGIANLIDDIVTLVNSVSGNADFKWQVASSSNTSPYYVVLKRKDASAGRILMFGYSSVPGTPHTTLFEASSLSGFNNYMWLAYFPNGNTDSPSNLTAGSGTIMGNDTNAIRVSGYALSTTIYGASIVPHLFDSQEAVAIAFNNPGATGVFMWMAGDILVDANDDAYPGVFANDTSTSMHNIGANSTASSMVPAGTAQLAGTLVGGYVNSNVGATGRKWWIAFRPNGWADRATLSDDPLQNAATSKAYFVPIQLVSNVKGVGFGVKFRQFTWGPQVNTQYATFNEVGPVVAAMSMHVSTQTPAGYPWFTNFKI